MHPRSDIRSWTKDTSDEAFLAGLNRVLAAFEPEARSTCEGQAYGSMHIIGVPRAGTTLLSQLVASVLPVGYVSNFIAAFHRAPVTGIRLWRKLGAEPLRSTYNSYFGRTSGLAEPHEFGYFWQRHLGYSKLAESEITPEDVDWPALREELEAMSRAFGAPLAMKPLMLVWALTEAATQLPSASFVRVRRDLVDCAVSLLEMRLDRWGDRRKWTSLLPRACESLVDDEPAIQVAAQVYSIERALDTAKEVIPPGRWLDLCYDDMCRDPGAAVDAFASLGRQRGATPEFRRSVDLQPFPVRRRMDDPQLRRQVERALAKVRHDLV